MEKAPDAFRTISEVAGDLEIPQHVLRFWETRFAQIKPMKRSGGRRYYRPDDVDLLRGIRRLLYGEGYTIRGVQRILKEHGIKSVQGLVEGSPAPSFGAIEDEIRRSLGEPDRDQAPGIDVDDDDYEIEGARKNDGDGEGLAADAPGRHEPDVALLWPGFDDELPVERASEARGIDAAKLTQVLADLIACRQLLETAMKDA